MCHTGANTILPSHCVCGCLYQLHVKQMCIPLLGDTEGLREKEKKRGLGVRELEKTVATVTLLLLIKSPSFSHPSPYKHILIKSSSRCLYDSHSILLTLIMSSPPKPLHKSIYYISESARSWLLSSVCFSKTVSCKMSDKFSPQIYMHSSILANAF